MIKKIKKIKNKYVCSVSACKWQLMCPGEDRMSTSPFGCFIIIFVVVVYKM